MLVFYSHIYAIENLAPKVYKKFIFIKKKFFYAKKKEF